MQYCIGIASIGNTFFSIARVLQYFLKMGIGIGIANTFIEYWYLIYTNINSQYFSIAQERNLYWELVNVHVTSLSSIVHLTCFKASCERFRFYDVFFENCFD